tara:strand:- start:200 stop:2533 length:2334 start_codon:yes stop_codon:yes gene_type:complete
LIQNGDNGQFQVFEKPSENVMPLWPDGIIYHGSRILLITGLAVIVTLLFPPVGKTTIGRYSEGMVLTDPVIAEVPFVVPKSVTELQRERADAAAGVPPTFDHRIELNDTMVVRLEKFFDQLDTVAISNDLEVLSSFLLASSIVTTPDQNVLFLEDDVRKILRNTAISSVKDYGIKGVIEASQSNEIKAGRVLVRDSEGVSGRLVSRDDVFTGREFQDRVVDRLMTSNPELSGVLRLIMIRHTLYSLTLDQLATDDDREQARQAVPTTKANVVQQEAIVRANEPITRDDLIRLNAYETELRNLQKLEDSGINMGMVFGAFLLNLSILLVFGVLVYFIRPLIYGSIRWLILQAVLVLTYLSLARLIAINGFPPDALPIAFVTLTVAVLWDSRIALVLGMVVAVLTTAQPQFAGTDVLFLTMVGGAAAAMSVRVVRRRAQTWVFVAIISLSYSVVILALALLEERSASEIAFSLGWAGSNAALSAIIAMGFVPVFEWFTGITTDQTLLEWADPNRSLLRSLSLEAPGSYAHTINVANLGELAANSIGAHGLLCRVGLYYHDVGKVLKPHYFVENQLEGSNPHDKLKPDTSASIVREHVTEGLKLAVEDNVPKIVRNFITEHHGTQSIAFFYGRAKDEFGEDNVNEDDFRYPGPKPQSRETAIAMMADSIESAIRVLQDPTPERVRILVEEIIDSKQQDGQLDEAPLTLSEITLLKETFVKALSGIYHHRITYPSTQHITESPSDPDSQDVDSQELDPPRNEVSLDEDLQMELGTVTEEEA